MSVEKKGCTIDTNNNGTKRFNNQINVIRKENVHAAHYKVKGKVT